MLVDRAGLTDTDLVYEIGAGAGTITAALVAAAVDPALRPVRVTFDAWLRLHAAFLRMPDPLRSHVVGAEARLRRQQSHLQKEHRSRAPRTRSDPGPWPRRPTADRVDRVHRFPCHAVRVIDPKAVVKRGYDLVSRAYRADDGAEAQYGPWLDLLEVRVPPPAKVLDLGCGCGVPVARRLAPRYEVLGVDLSPVQIERARALVPTATFLCADMAALDFADASFDALVCLYSIIHLPLAEQRRFIRDLGRWLRPGGMLIATVGHRAWTGTERDWLGVPGGDMWWEHADAATYRRWLTDAGFNIESERFVPEGTGGHTFVTASVPY